MGKVKIYHVSPKTEAMSKTRKIKCQNTDVIVTYVGRRHFFSKFLPVYKIMHSVERNSSLTSKKWSRQILSVAYLPIQISLSIIADARIPYISR